MPATITIPKKEYEKLKESHEELERIKFNNKHTKAHKDEFSIDIKESLKDLKAGRVHWVR